MLRIGVIGGLGVLALVAGVLVDRLASHPAVDPPRLDARAGSADGSIRKARPAEAAVVLPDDPLMAAAFGKAQETLPEFFAIVHEGRKGITHTAVKIAVRDGDATEYFWIAPFVASGEGWSGRINTAPRVVKTLREGQAIAFDLADIVDWLYVEDGRMTGNFTACALLKGRPAAEIASFRRAYGLDCAAT